ncbi:MAG TPA: oligosaccharide flippase family protein [Chthonomonadaceae bacterium]|nr:oligosaccharide flippase family protein [Chthonomonadaceae bacterium]
MRRERNGSAFRQRRRSVISVLKRNILANFVGKGWVALMNLAFVPLYIKYLGIEAYGLVGFNLTLNLFLFLLDMGLSATMNREMARRSGQPEKAQEARDLVRTLEVIYWPIALVIALVIAGIAPWIAHAWIRTQHLSSATVQQAIVLMGLSTALQWPYSFYEGGLLGLERQVLVNGITAGFATLRGAGAVCVLALVAPTVQAFFVWQGLNSALMTLTVWACFHYSLPKTGRPARFDRNLLRETWQFAAGMTGISLVSLVLTQADKIVLSKLLTLEYFGYYTLASNVAGAIGYGVTPFFAALFPRFTKVVAQRDSAALGVLYHGSCQMLSIIVLPAALLVAIFSRELLLLWTRDPGVAAHTHLLVTLLVIGTACNAVMNVPYALQLAYGNTRIAFWCNVVAILLLIPLLLWLARRYGAVGGAIVWLILNSGYVLVGIPVFHRYYLRGEMWRWYCDDVGAPLLAALAIIGMSRWWIGETLPPPLLLLSLMGALLPAIGAAALAAPQIRERLLQRLVRARSLA